MSHFKNSSKASNHILPIKNDSYMERTARNHFWVGDEPGQQKIKNLRIAIAGLGGMGSNIAEIFVRLGVGHIKIADPDTIETTNINRQVIANRNTVGKKKAEACVEELQQISSDVEIVVYEEGVTKENAREFVSDVDFVVDEIDVFPLQHHVELHKAAREKNLPIYSSFVVGLGIHLYKFDNTKSNFYLEDFLLNDKQKIAQPDAAFLIDRFAHPLPAYLHDTQAMQGYTQRIQDGQVPIFGASTYLGQSLLCIRALNDHNCIRWNENIPLTPIMPSFLVLDPLDLTLKEAILGPTGKIEYKQVA